MKTKRNDTDSAPHVDLVTSVGICQPGTSRPCLTSCITSVMVALCGSTLWRGGVESSSGSPTPRTHPLSRSTADLAIWKVGNHSNKVLSQPSFSCLTLFWKKVVLKYKMYRIQNAVKEIVPTTLNLNSAKPQLLIRCKNADYVHVWYCWILWILQFIMTYW